MLASCSGGMTSSQEAAGRKRSARPGALTQIFDKHIDGVAWLPSKDLLKPKTIKQRLGMWKDLREASFNWSFCKSEAKKELSRFPLPEWDLKGGTREEWLDKMLVRFRSTCKRLGQESRRQDDKKPAWFKELFGDGVQADEDDEDLEGEVEDGVDVEQPPSVDEEGVDVEQPPVEAPEVATTPRPSALKNKSRAWYGYDSDAKKAWRKMSESAPKEHAIEHKYEFTTDLEGQEPLEAKFEDGGGWTELVTISKAEYKAEVENLEPATGTKGITSAPEVENMATGANRGSSWFFPVKWSSEETIVVSIAKKPTENDDDRKCFLVRKTSSKRQENPKQLVQIIVGCNDDLKKTKEYCLNLGKSLASGETKVEEVKKVCADWCAQNLRRSAAPSGRKNTRTEEAGSIPVDADHGQIRNKKPSPNKRVTFAEDAPTTTGKKPTPTATGKPTAKKQKRHDDHDISEPEDFIIPNMAVAFATMVC